MRTVRLMTCKDAMQAHILQGALENEGIQSVLTNENFSSLYNGLVENISGVDIFVQEGDYERAVQTLKAHQCWPDDLVLCPYCGSSQIRLILKKGHRLRAWTAAILSALTMTPPGKNHWEYECQHCGKHFDTPVSSLGAESVQPPRP